MIEIEVPNVGVRQFSSSEALADYIDAQENAWRWLEHDEFSSPRHPIRQGLLEPWVEARKRLRDLRVSPPEDKDRILEEVLVYVRNAFNTRGTLSSDSYIAAHLFELWQEAPGTSEAAERVFRTWEVLAESRHLDINASVRNLPYYFDAIAFKRGDADRFKAELNALEEVRSQANNIRNELQLEVMSGKQFAEEFKNDSALTRQEQARLFKEFMTNANSDFAAVLAAFNEHMKLKAPATYWREKAKKHIDTANNVLCGLVILSIVFIGAIGYELFCLLLKQINAGIEAGSGATPAQLPISYIPTLSMILVTLSLFIVLFRPLWRIYLSQVHQADVAKEKETMVCVFLALVKDKHAENEHDRHIVLGSLFSPTTTGLVGGGADVPQSPHENIMKVFNMGPGGNA